MNLADQKVHFEGLYRVKEDIQWLQDSYGAVTPGSVVWSMAHAPGRIFVKCTESWVYFEKMTVKPFGNKAANELVKLLFKS